MIFSQTQGAAQSYQLWIASSAFTLSTYGLAGHSAVSFSVPDSALNSWSHLVGTWDGSNLRIYLNGILKAGPLSATGTMTASTNPLRIGSGVGTSWFNGSIDDVRIYNRALSSDEISRQYIRSKYASTAPSWSTPTSEQQIALGVSSQSPTLVNFTSATLNGSLTGFGGDTSATVYFNYGLALDNLNQTTATQVMTDAGSFSQAISGLTADTTYYFQAVITDSAGTAYGSTLSFQTANFVFSKQAGNPIVTVGSTGTWDAGWVLDPNVIKESDGSYKMWYLGLSAGLASEGIGYATSTDGINWTKYGSAPVMTPGSAGAWDAYLWEARVIKDGETYKMWYQGATTGAGPFKTGYATSPDGITWTKYSGNPVLSGTTGKWDQDYAGIRSVIKIGNTYHAWYEANTGSAKFAVGYATSTDGINWTKVSTDAPVLQGDSGAWDDASLVPNVIKVGDKYLMFYSTRTGTAKIGIATSTDGQNWTKYSGNPVFDMLGASGTWDSLSGTALVSVIQDSASPQNFLLYYRGLKSIYQIGLINLQVAVLSASPFYIDTTPPSSFTLSSPSDNFLTNDNTPTLSWNASSDAGSGLAKYQLYIDGSLNRDNISSSAASTTPVSALSDGNHTWYIVAFDAAGNTTQSTSTWTIKVNTASSTDSSSSPSSTSSSTSAPICGDQAPGAKAPWLYGAIAQDSGSVLLYFTEADNPVNKYVLEYGTKPRDYPYGVQDMGVNSGGQMTFLVKSLSEKSRCSERYPCTCEV
jgi:predicted GH43/DUF377 family glycosyl hydrolase